MFFTILSTSLILTFACSGKYILHIYKLKFFKMTLLTKISSGESNTTACEGNDSWMAVHKPPPWLVLPLLYILKFFSWNCLLSKIFVSCNTIIFGATSCINSCNLCSLPLQPFIFHCIILLLRERGAPSE